VQALERSRASRGQLALVLTGIVAAVAVRAAQLAVKRDDALLLNDSLWYSAEAVVLADGRGFIDPFFGGPSAEHGPLTPLVLTVVSWVDAPVPWQRAVMTVVGIATVAGVALLARRLAGWWAAGIAAWIAALYPNLWMNDALVMSETLAAGLVVVVLWLGLDIVEPAAPRWRAAACGVAIGLATLARSELLLLLPLLAIVVLWARRREGDRWLAAVGLLVAGTAVPVLPWVGANLVRFEQPVLLTTNDGTTLLGANCPDSFAGPGVGGWSLLCVLDAPGPQGEDPAARSARQRRLAVRYATDHVERVPLVVAARIGRIVDVVGVRNMVDGDVGEERPRWAAWAGVVAFWALAVLAVVGLVRLPVTTRRVLLVPVASVAVTAIAFYGGHRIRAPAEPVVVVAAAVGALAVVGRLARRRVAS
jgi:4-amino-4-deoxy-L-arabinose transferase-like glycosyltransferase